MDLSRQEQESTPVQSYLDEISSLATFQKLGPEAFSDHLGSLPNFGRQAINLGRTGGVLQAADRSSANIQNLVQNFLDVVWILDGMSLFDDLDDGAPTMTASVQAKMFYELLQKGAADGLLHRPRVRRRSEDFVLCTCGGIDCGSLWSIAIASFHRRPSEKI